MRPGLGLVEFEQVGLFHESIRPIRAPPKCPSAKARIVLTATKSIMLLPMAGGACARRTPHAPDGRKIIHQQFAINPDDTERLMMELILTKKSQ